MVAYLAVAVAYNTFAVSSVVFSSTPEQEAAAAGYILLSMMAVCICSDHCQSAANYVPSFSGLATTAHRQPPRLADTLTRSHLVKSNASLCVAAADP